MRRIALIMALIAGIPVGLGAEEGFERLNGDQVLEALMGRKLSYDGGIWQTFDPSMRTTYFSGRPSAGTWAVRGDQYCSVWPPSDHWACYDMERKGDTIRFIGSTGEITDGVYAE